MTLLYDEELLPEGSYIDEMKRAAELACEGEGLDPDLCAVSVSFVGPEEIRELNRDYRDTDKVTDVLSFPQFDALLDDYEDFLRFRGEMEGEDEFFLLGDVVINKKRAEEQAAEFGHSVERELVYLTVHSVFHLLGYDHMEEEDKKVMRAKEEAVMNALGITREQ